MPKVKVARKSTAIDMTAMCDVAFLLLTFFMLTTKFKPQEAIQVDIPASTAQIPIPDNDILLIQVDPEGRTFLGVDKQGARLDMLDRIALTYKLQFTDKQKNAFKLLETWGMPIEQLPQFLDLTPEQRNQVKQPGIKTAEDDNQLINIILHARESNPSMRIAIKADKNTNYKAFDKLVAALQKNKVNKFNLITSARNAPTK